VIPQLFAGKQSSEQLRVWIAGCATGEEAYSVAMLLAEAADMREAPPAIQMFGSDLDERAISIAREGIYSEADVADLSEERLRRFFARDQTRYRVRRELRDMMLFAHHDIIKDPPFSHLDLVVCRNVLIYLNRAMQQRLIETFHFALRPGGYLFLGGSETADAASDLFAPFDKPARIYESRTAATRLAPPMIDAPVLAAPRVETRFPEIRPAERQTPADLHQRLLEQYAPPSIVVTEDYQIVHISEAAARYLTVPAGEPSRDLLRLLRPELRVDVRTALHQAVRDRTSVKIRDIPIGTDTVSVSIRPVLRDDDPPRGFLLVLLEPSAGTDAVPPPPPRLITPTEAPVSQLEEELERVRRQLAATVEQYESHVEEAKASNEELQAMNEELRSAAEELETSKEELQSVNEELTTVNQELKTKIDELAVTNNDFQNYINSTDIATIFVDRALSVKLFTPQAAAIFHLVDTDIGRPLAHIANTLAYDQLHQDIGAVLDRLQVIEREVQSTRGQWYLMRLLPYRTSDDRIDGVVLTFLDITSRVTAEAQVRTSEERLRLLIDCATDYAIFAMTPQGEIAFWNAGAERMFGYARSDVIGKHGSLLFTPDERAAGALEREIARAQHDGRIVEERVYVRKNGTRLTCSSVTTRLGDDAALGFVTVARDLTAERDAANALARAAAGMEERVAERTQDLQREIARRTVAHDHVTDLIHRLVASREEERAQIARDLHEQLGDQVRALRVALEQLRNRPAGAQPADENLAHALQLTQALGAKVDFLAWELKPDLLEELGLSAAVRRFARDWSTHHGVPVEVEPTAAPPDVSRDVELTFYRIAQEALDNIAIHAHATHATVSLDVRDGVLALVVGDDGIGFEATTNDGGRGLGLVGMRERASLVGATLEVESAPGSGTRVSLRYALPPATAAAVS